MVVPLTAQSRLAAAATVGSSAANEPIAVFPTAPRAADGSNPFADVPPPQECSPAHDAGPGKSYFPLKNLKTVQRDNPFVRGERYTLTVDLVNSKQQRFRIYVSGMTPTPVRRYLNETRACLERFAQAATVKRTIEPVRFDEILVRSAVTETKLSRTQLAAARDNLLRTGPGRLVDVLIKKGGDVTTVVANAAAAAEMALKRLVAAGQATRAEVAKINPRQVMLELAMLARTPFLVAANGDYMGPAQLGAALKRDPKRALAIGMESLPHTKKREVVWFAFDPTINAGVIHGYKSRCQRNSSSSVTRWAGAVKLTFWRELTPNPIGWRIADGSNPYPSGMSHSSYPTYRTYDVKVYGINSSSSYSVYGGWEQGTGGIRCNVS